MSYCPFLPVLPTAQKIVDENGKIYTLDPADGTFKDDATPLAGATALAVVTMQDTLADPYVFQPSEVLHQCMLENCKMYDGVNNRCGLKTSDLVVQELGFWAAAAGQKPPAATSLVNEYMGRQDMDGNGMIYGFDFHITEGRPPMLDALPLEGEAMTWTEYLETL